MPSQRLPVRVALVIVVFAVAAYLISATAAPTRTTEPQPAPSTGPLSAAAAQTLEVLETLDVKGRAPKTGYDRDDKFGTAWVDMDQNGCDTRNDVLARDLVVTTMGDTCRVLTGTLADPYTGTSIDFVRGEATSGLVQIDHVVALSNAWQTGAQQLDAERRYEFANDPVNLLAVDGPTNGSKGDGDAATWLPPNASFRCAYVSRQITVKAAYDLWVTPAEHDAMTRVLAGCP
ncbi:HNH endonuclease family protein [Conyzicola sp.]|uniref:HNH endonuclease family protein n=1 Tax=Conyzicola sp. TaxID=1969404 RepID=UPI003988A67F